MKLRRLPSMASLELIVPLAAAMAYAAVRGFRGTAAPGLVREASAAPRQKWCSSLSRLGRSRPLSSWSASSALPAPGLGLAGAVNWAWPSRPPPRRSRPPCRGCHSPCPLVWHPIRRPLALRPAAPCSSRPLGDGRPQTGLYSRDVTCPTPPGPQRPPFGRRSSRNHQVGSPSLPPRCSTSTRWFDPQNSELLHSAGSPLSLATDFPLARINPIGLDVASACWRRWAFATGLRRRAPDSRFLRDRARPRTRNTWPAPSTNRGDAKRHGRPLFFCSPLRRWLVYRGRQRRFRTHSPPRPNGGSAGTPIPRAAPCRHRGRYGMVPPRSPAGPPPRLGGPAKQAR